VRRGQQPPVDEEKSARQFEYLMQATASKGYDHYEISNFALPGRYARHNGNYWRGEHYLGVGPSAHSFDGVSRQWNIANNALYIKALDAQQLPFEREVLTPEQRYNEYIMTALRTIWGVEMPKLVSMGNAFSVHFEKAVQPYLAAGTVERQGEIYRLTRAGKLLADRIAMELFL
jgi:oxygen-independent coproporphyrinogen-3 oxidase